MERVITSSKGTGTMYKVDGYPIEVRQEQHKSRILKMADIWKERELHFLLLGMAPIDDPELIVYLAIKQPKLKGDEYGAQPLAEIFKPVIKTALNI